MATGKRRGDDKQKGPIAALISFLILCIASIVMMVLMALGNSNLLIPLMIVGTIAGISLLIYLT